MENRRSDDMEMEACDFIVILSGLFISVVILIAGVERSFKFLWNWGTVFWRYPEIGGLVFVTVMVALLIKKDWKGRVLPAAIITPVVIWLGLPILVVICGVMFFIVMMLLLVLSAPYVLPFV